MPAMGDPRLSASSTWPHNGRCNGAVVNKLADGLGFSDLDQLNIETLGVIAILPIRGPGEMGRDFVLHSSDYARRDNRC